MTRILAILISLVLFAPTAASADVTARVSLDAARQAALARVPGTVIGEKLKHKDKKKYHHPVWSIQIVAKADGQTRKVIIDGDSGKVIDVKLKKPKADKDKDKDKKKKDDDD